MSKTLLSKITEESIEYVDIRFTDPRGKLQHVTVCADQVDEDFLDEGFMFDGSSIAGWKSIEESDMKLMPDTDSVRTLTHFMPKRHYVSIVQWSSQILEKAMPETHGAVLSVLRRI